MNCFQAILAKALFDNLADAPDELSFRKGDVITVLEQDVDGLIGWWLCSLHGRQGIAPGNHLQEIKRRVEEQTSPQTSEPTEVFSFEDIDYDVPRTHEVADDYAVPRGTMSPDYDVPNVNRPEGFMDSSSDELQELQQQFNYPPGNSSLSNEINSRQSRIESVLNKQAMCVDVYDVPTGLHEDDMPQEVYDVPQEVYDVPQEVYDVPQEVYDMPQKAAGMEQSGAELFTDQPTDLAEVSRGESESKQPPLVHKEPDIYSEIYDVPLAAGDHEKEKAFERPQQAMKMNENENSVPEEKRNGAELNKPSNAGDVVAHVKKRNSGKRQSTSSSDSAKLSSEDDDYVDYQEIYGDGRGKDVNVYDVPVQVGACCKVRTSFVVQSNLHYLHS